MPKPPKTLASCPISVHISDTQSFVLWHAVLLYRSENLGTEATVATVHAVKDHQLSEGRSLAAGELEGFFSKLSGSRPRFLPPCVLAATTGTLIWHRPAQRARLWFAMHDTHGKRDPKHPLSRISGGYFPQPALVFAIRQHSVRIFALASDARPSLKTPLYHTPYWNISPQGELCIGSMQIPDFPSPADIPKIEQSFFQSNFTHANRERITHGPINHADLWRAVRKAKAFPKEYLISARQNLKSLIS